MGERLNWQAGQFIVCDLPIGEKRRERWRSYSLANLPNDNNILELCISFKEDGAASKYFFSKNICGEILKFKDPDGGFVLPDSTEDELFFLATGTGLVPFRSMLWEICRKNMPFQGINVYFGTRHLSTIIYETDFKKCIDKIPSLHFTVSLSREKYLPDNYPYTLRTGYIHQAYREDLKKRFPTGVPENIKFYICGWSGMVDEAVATLMTEFKIKRQNIRFELYG